MTKRMALGAMALAGTAVPIMGASKKEMLTMFANLFAGKTDEKLHFGAMYHTVQDVERLPVNVLESIPTTNTALQPVVDALNVRGLNTASTVGGVMKTVGLDQHELHDLVCYCHSGEEVSGERLASRFSRLAEQA